MHDLMYALQDMVLCDIEDITKKGKIEPNEYPILGEAVDIIKDLKTIEAMEEYGESPEVSGYMRRSSYNSYNNQNNGGYSTMRGRDARTGRYMSRDNSTMAKLQHMMDTASTEQERQTISRMMNELGV